MEWLNSIWTSLAEYIHVPYLLIFMLLSYLIKRHFSALLERVLNKKVKTVYIVLIIVLIVAIPFLIFDNVSFEKIVLTYTVGTSLHELVFAFLEKKIIGSDEKD